MAGYIFLPIPNAELLEHADAWIHGQHENFKTPYEILHNRHEYGRMKGLQRRLVGGCLEKVSPQDKLYILIHGADAVDARFVGDDRSDGELKRYTPETLAAVLRKEGLTTQIQDVRLYSCRSGEAGQLPAWAARLKNAMVQKGYDAVTVTGYLGDVRGSYAARVAADGRTWEPGTHKGVYDRETDSYVRPSTKRMRF